MAALIATLLNIIANWSRDELIIIRNRVYELLVGSLLLLLTAGYVGGWSWWAKLVLIELDIAAMLIATLVMAAHRVRFTAAVAAGVAASSKQLTLVNVAHGYLRILASVFAAEIFAGLVTLWAPVHSNMALSFLGLFIGIGYLVYWLWTGEEVDWWKRTVNLTLGLSLAAAASGVVIPYLIPNTTAELVRHGGGADAKLAEFLRGTASPQTVFWVVVALLVTMESGAYFLKEKARRPVRWLGRVVAAALLASWLIWGAGWGAVAPYAGAAPAVERQLTVTLRPECVNIAMRLPARGIIDWDTRQARKPEAMFNDGSRSPLRGNLKERGDVHSVCGEGILVAKWRE